MRNIISFIIILILTSIPSLIGPIANIGQWAGPQTPYMSIILTGVPSMIIGAWIGYNFIFLNGTRKNIESNSNAINNSLLIFFFTFLACSVSWIVCQEIQLLLHKAFGMKEASKHGWFDGIIGLPILIIFSIVPCLIAAFINGVISFLIFKRQKTNQFKV